MKSNDPSGPTRHPEQGRLNVVSGSTEDREEQRPAAPLMQNQDQREVETGLPESRAEGEGAWPQPPLRRVWGGSGCESAGVGHSQAIKPGNHSKEGAQLWG